MTQDASRSSGEHRLWSVAIAAGSALGALLASQAIELFINRVLRPDAEELTWISESLIAVGFLLMTALWIRLRKARAELSASERARLAVETQLSVAAEVQRALLPAIPPPIEGVYWFASVEPAGKVGGDYYDFLPLPTGDVCVVIGDVSGKGIAAAVFLSNVRAVVRALVRETASPAELLARLSETLLADVNGEMYATCVLGLVSPIRRTFIYSNAGHPPGVFVGKSGMRGLGVGGPPVGLIRAIAYEEETVTFGEGDLVALVSDGVTDALDIGGATVVTALGAIIARETPLTPEGASRALLSAARSGSGPLGVSEWMDDRTAVAFGIPQSGSAVVGR